jgi:hypothetical protein
LVRNLPDADIVKFEQALTNVKSYMDQADHPLAKYMTVYAWNEWHEGSFIEPNVQEQAQRLGVIARVFGLPLGSDSCRTTGDCSLDGPSPEPSPSIVPSPSPTPSPLPEKQPKPSPSIAPSPSPVVSPSPSPQADVRGTLDELNYYNCTVSGWSVDLSTSGQSNTVDIYLDNPYPAGTYLGSYPTTLLREDVNEFFRIEGIHGFVADLSSSRIRFKRPREIYVYGHGVVDTSATQLLVNSPQTMWCR